VTARLIIHADDVGMCHGANTAFVELSRAGGISSGSVMAPCPWFPEIAEAAAADPTLDVGVHLTLNAEKQHYRWRPVSGLGPSSGLVDGDGYMWRDVTSVRRHARVEAVEQEWRAQIDVALARGIDITHLDAHMGSALAPEWCDVYVRLGVEYRVPVLITATLSAYAPRNHLAGVTDEDFAPFVQAARAAGVPVVDRVLETDFGRPRGAPVDYQSMLAAAGDGLTFCAFHPNAPGEVQVIESDTWHVRTDEHRLFGSAEWIAWLQTQPFEVVGMGVLREEMRAATRPSAGE
jgi:predicted glycoside hydrolase/deacetylase ChbG (UPF0249 family)